MFIQQRLIQAGFIAVGLRQTPLLHFELDVAIENKLLSFVIDTSASNTVISLEAVRKIGVKFQPVGALAGGMGVSDAETFVRKNQVLKLQSIEITDVELFAVDFTHINTSLKHKQVREIDGVLGADILQKYQAIIDYHTHVLYLKPI